MIERAERGNDTMAISTFDMFTIGIGPSSSHTVGPMRGARRFAKGLISRGLLDKTQAVKVELYGSLGSTGRGHGSDTAVLLGLEGEDPESVDPDKVSERTTRIHMARRLLLAGEHEIRFAPTKDIVFYKRRALKLHPNAMRFSAFDASANLLHQRVYYSVGGGFVVDEAAAEDDQIVPDTTVLPHPFTSGAELMLRTSETGLSIARLAMRGHSHQKVSLDEVIETMRQTGHDMMTKYKETARGGLAVNIIEC